MMHKDFDAEDGEFAASRVKYSQKTKKQKWLADESTDHEAASYMARQFAGLDGESQLNIPVPSKLPTAMHARLAEALEDD